MSAKAFFLKILSALTLTLVGLGGCNYLVDPSGLFSSPTIDGVNRYRTAFFSELFVSKPHLVSRRRPDGLILGTSRAGTVLRSSHPAWKGYEVYNFSLPGTTAYIQWLNFQHASAAGPLGRVVLSLDFMMFNSCDRPEEYGHLAEYENRLRTVASSDLRRYQRTFVDYMEALFSWRQLRHSVDTLRSQALFGPGKVGLMYLQDDGFWQSVVPRGQRQRKLFRRVEANYRNNIWRPGGRDCFELAAQEGFYQLGYLQQLLSQAHVQGVEMRVYFSPIHARLQESMRAVGLWEKFEQVKREVTAINARVAAEHGVKPFPLWDFSGYSRITTEKVPPLEDSKTRMRFFFDPTHATPATGQLILDQIFPKAGKTAAPSVFGRRLTPDSVEAILAGDRQGQQRWVADNAADSAYIWAQVRN